MKRSVLLALCIPFIFSASASADDFKQEVGKIVLAYVDCFSKQDPACVAGLYTNGENGYAPTNGAAYWLYLVLQLSLPV